MINHYQNEAETYNEIIIEKELSATRKSRNAIAIAIVTTIVYKIVRKKNIMLAAILLLMASISFLLLQLVMHAILEVYLDLSSKN